MKLLETSLNHNQKIAYVNLRVKFSYFLGFWQTHFVLQAFLYWFQGVHDQMLKHDKVYLQSQSTAIFQLLAIRLKCLLFKQLQSKNGWFHLFLFEVWTLNKLQLFLWIFHQLISMWSLLLASRKDRLSFGLTFFLKKFIELILKKF